MYVEEGRRGQEKEGGRRETEGGKKKKRGNCSVHGHIRGERRKEERNVGEGRH